MPMIIRATLISMLLTFAASAQETRTETIRFAAGTSGTTINDRITGYESVLYRIGANAGQRMKVRLEPSNLATYFNVYAPGRGPGDEALANAQITGPLVPDINIFDADLEASGDYTISIYLMRSAARRNEVSTYSLAVSIEDERSAPPPSDEAAAGTSTERVRFAAGSTGAELTGSLMPGESRRYVLGAKNGQFLDVRVAANGPNVTYQIFNPDNSFLLDQMTSAQDYRGQLWQSGDHVVEVINRGNGPQSYTLSLSIDQ